MKRWLTDWRSLATIVAAVLVGLLAVLVVTSIADRQQAIHALQGATASEREARAAAVHRIDQLLVRIDDLEVDAQANGQALAVLRRELGLLQQQVRDLGGQPVVSGGTGESSPQARPPTSARPTPRPTPTPSPSRTCLLILCP